MLGSERYKLIEVAKKQDRAERAALEADQKARTAARIAPGVEMETLGKQTPTGGVSHEIYQSYVFLRAADGDNEDLKKQAAQYMHEHKISAAGFNFDLSEARRHQMLISLLSKADQKGLEQTRAAAVKKRDAAKESLDAAEKELRTAQDAERSLQANIMGRQQLINANLRLFGALEDLKDDADVRQHYSRCQLPL